MMWGRPGAADYGDIFIKGQVTIKAGTNMERPGPLAAHKAFDYIVQEIREALKAVEDESLVVDTQEFNQYRRKVFLKLFEKSNREMLIKTTV